MEERYEVEQERIEPGSPLGFTHFPSGPFFEGGYPTIYHIRVRDKKTGKTATGVGDSREAALENALEKLR